MSKYQDFLRNKARVVSIEGIPEPYDLPAALFPFQRDIVSWALRKGRAAIFADCGLGKTPMQLSWAHQVARHTGERVLILAPLAVSRQTHGEGEKFNLPVQIVRDQSEVTESVVVTNYEMLEHMRAEDFGGIVLDESSILKAFDGKTRTRIIESFSSVKFRLACTATPAPNDFMELGNHSEFLGVLSRTEMLAEFFVHDGGETQKWRLKGHAEAEFWKWVCEWAVAMRKPSDLGYEDDGFNLPAMNIVHHITANDDEAAHKAGRLFAFEAHTLDERRAARRGSTDDRADKCREILYAHQRTEASIQQGVSRETSGEAQCKSIRMVPREQGLDRQGTAQVLHGGLSDSESRQMAADADPAEKDQRSPEGIICPGGRAQSEGAGRGEEMAEGESRKEEISAIEETRNNPRGISEDLESPESFLRDMPPLRQEGTELLPIGRSLPQDRPSSWAPLHELQSGARQVQGQPGTIDSGSQLSRQDQWVVWCDFNAEQDILERIFGDDCVSIRGSTPIEEKIELHELWITGQRRIMLSKPSIFSFGMNWQRCSNMVFCGLSDSYERFYQAIRRCWRFGQKNEVTVHIITSGAESAIVKNIQRKEAAAVSMANAMVKHMSARSAEAIRGRETSVALDQKIESESGENWTVYLGDCIEAMRVIPDDSIHYSVFSPPFASLYTYSSSERDMGNTRTDEEFAEHFGFLIPELYRALMPGRLCSVHCMNLPTSKVRDGVIGIRDFRGEIIRSFVAAGWIYHSEVVIWKDPVTSMQRTKALGLLHKQLKKDSCMSRQGIPDYVVTFRKPGDNPERVTHTNESFPVSIWQRYASPIWMDINATRTLQKDSAREEKDERHICPLQLDVIERCVDLWTNPGDIVLSPFAGIGSEGVVAVERGRRFTGIELKRSYFNQAVANLKLAEARVASQGNLFDSPRELQTTQTQQRHGAGGEDEESS